MAKYDYTAVVRYAHSSKARVARVILVYFSQEGAEQSYCTTVLWSDPTAAHNVIPAAGVCVVILKVVSKHFADAMSTENVLTKSAS